MNIIEPENKFIVEAKICGYNNNKKIRISYHFIESTHSLYSDKREILFAQIRACERLLIHTTGQAEISVIKREIVELHLALVASKDITNREIGFCTIVSCSKKAIVCCTVCSDYCCYEHLQGHAHLMDNFKVRI